MTAITAPASALTGTYAIDPSDSRVGFVARHATVTKVRGSFNGLVDTGYVDPRDPHLELTIEAASIDTRHADRDPHRRGSELVAVDAYPQIRFAGTAAEATAT
ncbi:MAG TPA: YceI family protein [Acidimicrobiales bacterium]|nr:YceI family protein [Acidimicrobiales bacterium]